MDRAVSERRAHERADDGWAETAKATLLPGHPISIVNISRGGALVEGRRPMRPGTRVMVQITTPVKAFGLSAVVVRCAIQSLTRDDGVVYRGGLKFDERHDWTRALSSHHGSQQPRY